MANLFAYPFRVNPDGTIAKTPEGEDSYADELVNLILTQPGERHLAPDYGVDDPVFDELNTVELLGKIEMFGPPVDIKEGDVAVVWPRDGHMVLNIEYTPAQTSEDDMMINDMDDVDDDYYDNEDSEPNINDYYGFNQRTDY